MFSFKARGQINTSILVRVRYFSEHTLQGVNYSSYTLIRKNPFPISIDKIVKIVTITFKRDRLQIVRELSSILGRSNETTLA